MNNFLWLQQWYAAQTDGDWEHTYGILIKTLDNPGWRVEIDLTETPFAEICLEYRLFEVSETDWHTLEVKESVFRANGDPLKLDFMIGKFREIIEAAEIPAV